MAFDWDKFESASEPERTPASSGEFLPNQGEQVGQIEAGLRGGAQGLSLGTSEEILAGLGTVGDLPSTGFDWQKLKAAYEQNVAAQRAREHAAAEQNPITYHGAEIAAPFLIPAAGALGAAGKLGKAGGLIAESANLLNVPGKVIEGVGAGLEALPGAAKLAKAAPMTSKILKGAGEGAILGGAYGAGKTEAPLTSEQGLNQIKESAEFGGILGGGLSTLGAGVSSLATRNAAGKGVVGDLSRAYLSGLEGKDLSNFDKIVDNVYNYGQVTGNKLLINEVQRIKNAFNTLEASGDKKAGIAEIFDALKNMKENAKYASDPEAQKIIQGVTDTLLNKAYGLEELVQKQTFSINQKEIPGQERIPSSKEQVEGKLPELRATEPELQHQFVEKADPVSGQKFHAIESNGRISTDPGGEIPIGKPKRLENSPENRAALEEIVRKNQANADLQNIPYRSQITEDAMNGEYILQEFTSKPQEVGGPKLRFKTPASEEVPGIEPRVETTLEPEPFFAKERPGMFNEQGGVNRAELPLRDLTEMEKLFGQRSFAAEGGSAEKEIYGTADKLFTKAVDELSPEYAQTREQFKQMSRAFNDVNIDPNKALQLDVGSPELQEVVNRVAPKEMAKINGLIAQKLEGGLEGRMAEQELEAFYNRLQKAGFKDIPQIQQKLESNMQDLLLSEKISGTKISPAIASHNPKVQALGALKSFGMRGVHEAGLLQQSPLTQNLITLAPATVGKEFAANNQSPVENFSRDLSYSSNEELQPVINSLKNDKNLSYLGNALEQAMANKDSVKINAIKFAISQNPEARKYLGK